MDWVSVPHHCWSLCSSPSFVRTLSRVSSSGFDGECRLYSAWENRASNLATSAVLTWLRFRWRVVAGRGWSAEVRLGWNGRWRGSQLLGNWSRTSKTKSRFRVNATHNSKAHRPCKRRPRHTLTLAGRDAGGKISIHFNPLETSNVTSTEWDLWSLIVYHSKHLLTVISWIKGSAKC